MQEPQDPCPCLGIREGFLEEMMFPLSPEEYTELKEAKRVFWKGPL